MLQIRKRFIKHGFIRMEIEPFGYRILCSLRNQAFTMSDTTSQGSSYTLYTKSVAPDEGLAYNDLN